MFSYYSVANLVLPPLWNSAGPVTQPLLLELCQPRRYTPLPCWPQQGAMNFSGNIAPPPSFELLRKVKSASSVAPPLRDELRWNHRMQSFTAVMPTAAFYMTVMRSAAMTSTTGQGRRAGGAEQVRRLVLPLGALVGQEAVPRRQKMERVTAASWRVDRIRGTRQLEGRQAKASALCQRKERATAAVWVGGE